MVKNLPNPSSASLTLCVRVKPDLAVSFQVRQGV